MRGVSFAGASPIAIASLAVKAARAKLLRQSRKTANKKGPTPKPNLAARLMGVAQRLAYGVAGCGNGKRQKWIGVQLGGPVVHVPA